MTTAHTFDPSRCEYCGGERWIAFGEPCTACNASGKLRPWEDWPEDETERRHEQQRPHLHRRQEDHEYASSPRLPERRSPQPLPQLLDVLKRGDEDGLPVRAHSERIPGHRLIVRDRRTSASRHQVADWPEIPVLRPITTAVRGLDPEAWW